MKLDWSRRRLDREANRSPPLRLRSYPSYSTPSYEAPMPFSIRPHRRFPVYCQGTYHAGFCEGHGTIWNVSLNG
jgi:hypothetical protein